MTRGYWKCVYCGFGREIHISIFIKLCPQCKGEYELLGYLKNYHICHKMPLFKPKEAPYSKCLTNGYFFLARSNKNLIFECINEGYFQFLEDQCLDDVIIRKISNYGFKGIINDSPS